MAVRARTRWRRSLAVFAAMAFALSTCAATEWTFLVYLDGDNNLESYGIDNFLQMASVDGLTGGDAANVRVLVQFDRINGYDTSYGNWTGCKRFEVTKGLTPAAANAVQSLGPTNMGDPNTLTSFLDWGMGYAPATHYALVLWNHGSGWAPRAAGVKSVVRAVCYDDTSGGDALTAKELRTALASAAASIDVIGFDACLMAMLEVAYEVKDEASVFVASEQLEDASGWPYDAILRDLVATPAMTPAELGAVIVNRYGTSPAGATGTMSAVDLAKVGGAGGLAEAVSAFADTVLLPGNQDWQSISDSRDAASYFDDQAFRDLKTCMTGVAAYSNNASVKARAQAVVDVFGSGLVIANYTTASNNGAGLSFYFPPNQGVVDTDYTTTNILFAEKSWDEFLAQWVAAVVPPPPNDNFADRIALTGETASASAATSRATKEDGEPDHAGNAGGHSVWWSWTPPAHDMTVAINTYGSSFDTLLAVYTGASVSALTEVTSDDDYNNAQPSRVTFHAVFGTEYKIAVDGYDGAGGGVSLSLAEAFPPPNDDFASRIALTGADVSAGATNVDAGREGGEPLHAAKTGGSSLWWSWQAPADGNVTINTGGSNFDTLLGVYTGSAVAALSAVASNDNYGGQKTSRVSFGVVSGATYQIAVDGYRGATGTIALNLHFVPQVATPAFSPPGGAYAAVQSVTISCATDGAAIYYTTDGSTPTASSLQYAGPVRVATSLALNAFATKAGAPDSNVASADYSLPPTVATPAFSPGAGAYQPDQAVSVSCATEGATIYVSTDGSTPTTPYAGPIHLGASATLKAYAAKAGMLDSDLVSADYTIGPPPRITSGPVVVTSVVVAGQPVQFTCAADDPGVTWYWDFGDGTAVDVSGGVATHTYGAAGAYTVTLTATGSNGVSTTLTLVVDVKAAGSVSNTAVDSDGDGFPNEIEEQAGSSPTDASSTPFAGAPAGTPQPLRIAKMALKLSFTGGKDTIALNGTVHVTDGFQVNAQNVVLDVGGVVAEFPLDAKGASPKGQPYSFKLAAKSKNKVVAAQDAKFTAKFTQTGLAAFLADEGLTDTNAKGELHSVPVIILLDGMLFSVDQPQLYTATAGKSGKTAMPR